MSINLSPNDIAQPVVAKRDMTMQHQEPEMQGRGNNEISHNKNITSDRTYWTSSGNIVTVTSWLMVSLFTLRWVFCCTKRQILFQLVGM